MAGQDRIDLIKEFTKNQKNNDYIILTTYCFDPFFFDVYLLNKIQSNNPASEIILLVDAEQYEKSYNRFTKDTGRKYHLVPIYMDNGVFHPKFFLFLSESEKKLTLYIGSGNVTLQGFTRNVELVSKIEHALTEKYSNMNKILEILNGLVNKNFVNELKVREIIQEVVTIVSSKTSDTKEDLGCSILHNLEESILSQLLNELRDKKFKELFILAPFLSQKPKVLEELVSNTSVRKVILALQKNNHNLKDVSSYSKLLSAKGVSFEIREAQFEDRERRFHSKILYLNGNTQYLLVGSPNLTNYALLETAGNGNFECAVLYSDIKAKEILSSIHLSKVKDLDSLLKTAELKEEISKSILLRIYSADFDDIGRMLKVKTEKINDEAVVLVSIENPDEIIKKSLRLDKGEFTIAIPRGAPKELIITCGDKSSRKRIFYDKNYFFKRIIRAPISFKEISDRLYNDLSIDISDLLTLISGLSRSLEIEERPREKGVADKDSSKFYLPSRVRSISGVSSLLKTLQKLHEWINFKNQETRELEESYSDEDSEKKPKLQYPHYLDEEEERKRLINKIIDKLNQIILLSASRSIDENKEDSLGNSQSIFINCFLRMFRKTVDEEIFENFKEALENNLKNVRRENCSKDSVVKLFSHLLSLNYCYKYQRTYSFMRDLFSYSDLIGKNDYCSIKQFTKELVERYYDEIGFDMNKFMQYYSSMMVFVFSPSDIKKGIVDIANQIVLEQDSEFVRFLGEILSAIKHGPWDHPGVWAINNSLLDEIRKIRNNAAGQKLGRLIYLEKFLE